MESARDGRPRTGYQTRDAGSEWRTMNKWSRKVLTLAFRRRHSRHALVIFFREVVNEDAVARSVCSSMIESVVGVTIKQRAVDRSL
jgi:hypothetical protein